jgi:hypothetical protein
MSERQAIFIFGMGRSGTSALARVLSLCGASLPERLIGANAGNPKGYWEPLDALVLNEDFLSRHGATWYDPTLRLQSDLIFDDRDRADYVDRIRTFLESCPGGRPVVLKEPRIAALSDFWFEAARRAGFALNIVIPVRHPAEVAGSLATRDGASLELSSALWLKYNLLAERQSRGLPRVFVEYSNLLSDWRQEVDRISAALSIVLAERDEIAIDAFLSRDLHRSRVAGPPLEVFGQPWMSGVYAQFSAAARDAPLDLQVMNEIFSAYRAGERTFRLSSNEFRNRFSGLAWASDLSTFLGQVLSECTVEIARRLGEPVEVDGASIEQLRTAFARQADRVSEVVKKVADLERGTDTRTRSIFD